MQGDAKEGRDDMRKFMHGPLGCERPIEIHVPGSFDHFCFT